MMKQRMSRQWTEFQNTVAAMADNSSPREIFNAILSFLRRNPEIFSVEPFLAYRFDRFFALKDEDFPVEISSMCGVEFEHFKRIIKKYTCEDTENIARYLRDTLETLIVMEVEKECPRCERWGMGVHKNSRDGRVAFECRQCGFASYMDGSRVSVNELSFATKDDLRNAGMM